MNMRNSRVRYGIDFSSITKWQSERIAGPDEQRDQLRLVARKTYREQRRSPNLNLHEPCIAATYRSADL